MGKITEGEREEKKKNGNFPNTMFFFCLFCFLTKRKNQETNRKINIKQLPFTRTHRHVFFSHFLLTKKT